MNMPSYFGDRSGSGATLDGQHLTVAAYTALPYSRGYIHVTGPSLADLPDFDCGIFGDPQGIDILQHVWAYKKQREILRRTALYRGELPQDHPPFAAGSAAACVELTGALGDDGCEVKDLTYSAEDDAVIKQHLRNKVASTWHSLGTARMAPRDQGGVVDADLSVYEVTGLKVVDLSICPENVAANTANTAFMVGEKGAAIVKRELDLFRRQGKQQPLAGPVFESSI